MPSVPTWYWIVTGLLVFWNAFGLFAFVADWRATPQDRAKLTEGQRKLIEARPGWVLGVYGIATASGLAGSAGLLFQAPWTLGPFVVSLVAVIVQFGYILFVMRGIELLGGFRKAAIFPLVIIAIAAASVGLAQYAKGKGWLLGY